MAGLVMLNEEQLPELAELIYRQEVNAIHNIKFPSEYERSKYLDNCRECRDKILSILEAGVELDQKFQNSTADQVSIAHEIFGYVKSCVNSALQTVPNYTLRLDYVSKIGDHAKSLIELLNKLDPTDLAEVEQLAKTASQYNKAMLKYCQNYQSGASKYFSKWINQSGMSFEQLANRYAGKLGFKGAFKDLEEAQKLKVYETIIEESGRASVTVDLALTVVGVAVLLFTAGLMVWDIFSSDHILETATRDAMTIAAAVGGAMLGSIVEAALVTLEGVEATGYFVVIAGFVTSVAGGFVLGLVAGALVDLIFGSGGSSELPNLSTDGYLCYVSPLPDGAALARQIA